MEHREYLRLVEGADTAVLFVHGILGTPHHFDPFLPLVPKNWSVCNLLLDGHGAGVREFSRTSMERWQAQVEEAAQQLERTHSRLLIVGHSMGTLLAIRHALRPESQVAGLFFLACPLKLRLRFRMVTNSAKVYLGWVRPHDKAAQAGQKACGIRHEWQFWRYLGWIPRFMELFRLIRQTRQQLSQLRTPCWAFQSGRDEMVSCEAGKLLEGQAALTVLPESSHFYYDPEDLQTVLGSFAAFCSQK